MLDLYDQNIALGWRIVKSYSECPIIIMRWHHIDHIGPLRTWRWPGGQSSEFSMDQKSNIRIVTLFLVLNYTENNIQWYKNLVFYILEWQQQPQKHKILSSHNFCFYSSINHSNLKTKQRWHVLTILGLNGGSICLSSILPQSMFLKNACDLIGPAAQSGMPSLSLGLRINNCQEKRVNT